MLLLQHDSSKALLQINMVNMKIGEPKSLHVIEAEGHGYNAAMNPFLEAELAKVFS